MRRPPTIVTVFTIIGVVLAFLGGSAWYRGGILDFESGDVFFSFGAPLTIGAFKLFETHHVVLTDLDNSWAIPFMAFLLIVEFAIWGVLLHFASRVIRVYLQKHA
jgi:hypothetical protein